MPNPFSFFRPSPEPVSTPPSPLDIVHAYHSATSHHYHRFARGPAELDWDTQPDPFRRYTGAQLLPLDHIPATDDITYDDALANRVPARPLDRSTLSALLLDAFGLTAWKQYATSTWSLRANPSSGNLHPTEAYVLSPSIPDVASTPFLAHYAPREHALELRARVPLDAWESFTHGYPPGTLFVALTSIHWRESWKYGERAYRYCQHDVGHALGALFVSAAALGWHAELVDALGHSDLQRLLGHETADGPEAEEPDVLVALAPRSFDPRTPVVPAGWPVVFDGEANELSSDHVHWNAIDAVTEACRKPPTASVSRTSVVSPGLLPPRTANVRAIVRQRRSAVDFDGVTSISTADFTRMLAATTHGLARRLPWKPNVHFALFVHRVTNLDPGLYLLARDPDEVPFLRAAFEKPFAWERVDLGVQNLSLHRLATRDERRTASALSCHQDIAADSAFSLGMLARFEPALLEHGAWFYPRLYWECGLVGQILYLEAEAAGVRATGIGCFFDEPVHAHLGLSSTRYRSLYHFTVGGPVEDERIQAWPAYPPPAPLRPGAP